MTNDQGPVVQSAMLRAELIDLRRERNLTQEAVARELDWHPTKIIRIEGGKSRISKTDLQALLREYGVASQSRQERLLALAQGAREPAWWDRYRDVINDATVSYIGHESGAAVIRQFENSLIPGTLQTREYAAAIVSHFVSGIGGSDLERRVELRMRRQEDLAQREDPPRCHYILDEAAIRRHIGMRSDPLIMPSQLRHIVERAEGDDRITLRVVPFSAGAYPGLEGPFTLLGFDKNLDDILYQEGASSLQTRSVFTRDPDIVSDYRDAFEAISGDALSVRDSIALIRKVADEHESEG